MEVAHDQYNVLLLSVQTLFRRTNRVKKRIEKEKNKMRTSRITLFYQLTQTGIIPPVHVEIERKDNWIKEIQKTIEADWKPRIIKVIYEMFNPEIEKQRRFFEGAVIDYYAIQNSDILKGSPDTETHKKYREEILDEMLGYDFRTVNKIIRKRKSTTDFKTVQKWNTFLQTLEETLFDSAGYIFPDSENFWELTKKYGYDQAKRISIETLQAKLKKKYESKHK